MDGAIKQGSPRPGARPISKLTTSGMPKPGESTKAPEVDLQAAYGPPAFKNKTGDATTKLNEPFWAALYAKENIVLHEPDLERFFWYNPTLGIYEEKTSDAIREELAARILQASVEWKEFYPGLVKLRNSAQVHGIIQHLKGISEEREAFSKNAGVIHLANCDLRITETRYLVEPISAKSKARWRLPFNYDPHADCPRFKNELLTPLDLDQLLVVQKVLALYLTGENPLHKIVILDGEAGGGKTTLALVFQEIFGPRKAGSLRTSLLDERFELGRFYDKTLLIGADVGPQFLQESGAGALKKLTGGDYLEAELKTSNRVIELYGRFNVLITANVRLKIRLADDASAWLRRLIIIRYRKQRTGTRILDFHKILMKEEGPGILNWGLAGLELLRKDIDQTGDIVLSPEITRTVQSLVEESDGLRLFLRNNIQSDEFSDISVDELVRGFTGHCQKLGWSMEPIGKIHRDLESLMMELFSRVKRNDIKRWGKAVRGYKGVKFSKTEKDPSEASEEDCNF
jgi:hypothetical protein